MEAGEEAFEGGRETPSVQNDGTATTSSSEEVVTSASRARIHSEFREQAWIQWLVILILVFSDILLVFLIADLLSTLQDMWEQEQFLRVTAVSGVVYVVWIAMRALLGLYPGYGLDQPEE